MAGNAYRVHEPKPQRVFEVWQGNETFFCWGRLVAGPNWRACIGTAFLLLAPTGIFLGFVAPYVTRQVHAIIMVFSCLLPALCTVFLFLTACRDPGIIPRQEPDEEYLSGRKPRTQEVMVNGHRVVIRYNDTCHFYQPPRAHHCSVNDNCIERFDHHCPWVGTTIGRRNYRTFLLFIFSATALCLYVIGVCLAQLFLRHRQLQRDAEATGKTTSGLWGETIGDVIPALVIMAYTFIFSWFVGGLSGFHCYLVSTNQTTYENFRYNHDNRVNPFNRGIFRNCAEVWCSPTPKSQIDFRAFVDPHKGMNSPASDLELAPQLHSDPPGQPQPYQEQGNYHASNPPHAQAIAGAGHVGHGNGNSAAYPHNVGNGGASSQYDDEFPETPSSFTTEHTGATPRTQGHRYVHNNDAYSGSSKAGGGSLNVLHETGYLPAPPTVQRVVQAAPGMGVSSSSPGIAAQNITAQELQYQRQQMREAYTYNGAPTSWRGQNA